MPKREKMQHVAVSFCIFLLVLIFLVSAYRLSGVRTLNIIPLCLGVTIFFLRKKNERIARYISGSIFFLAGISVLGFFIPMDGNIHDISIFSGGLVLIIAVFFMLLASLCFDQFGRNK